MTSPRVRAQADFLLDLTLLIQWASEQGWVVTGGELFRTPEQQALHVQAGRSKTMASRHLDRQACDLNFFWQGELVYDRERLRPIGEKWESLNPLNSWGGNWKSFKDVPHFERRAG